MKIDTRKFLPRPEMRLYSWQRTPYIKREMAAEILATGAPGLQFSIKHEGTNYEFIYSDDDRVFLSARVSRNDRCFPHLAIGWGDHLSIDDLIHFDLSALIRMLKLIRKTKLDQYSLAMKKWKSVPDEGDHYKTYPKYPL